ncbi:4-hydroxy-tetrahydrodipicolinate synthase [Cupriavidus basilensis]|uniref:4-hydroxy-tetrahydrodipicolinate synthase n=1 Tax=Cupriavidus basilensis TaxID=68895 RepID=A0ABT6APV3_9BURK|nr:4-hydroxy-tetrahydrodipicolinate synthase [Cupriavidus basilensis]MDF3834602.1 4-hydroxy-tetrahydrodipicolinate synthase [Cupriavidus basilensis]
MQQEQQSQQSQQSQPVFSGIWLPLVTPFAGGAVDHAALARLVARYAGSGIAGFVVCGSTGEAAALDEDEQLAVLDAVLAGAGVLPVMMGVSGSNVRQVQARVRRLADRPLAGLLAPAPYYVRPSQAGLLDYFRGLADSAAAPLVLYDIPYRTGVKIEPETMLALAAHPNIRAIKDCGGDYHGTQAAIADGRLAVLAGEDHQLLGTLCLGGAGAIIASAHLYPELFVALARAVAQQRLELARRIFHTLMPMIRQFFSEPNPGPLKAMLARQGWLRNELRAPMTPASEALEAALAQACEQIEAAAPGLLG